MVTRQTVVVVSVVLVATIGVVVPAVSAAPTGPAVDETTIAQASALQTATDTQTATVNETDEEADTESDLGNQMTAFMQSNAAHAEDSVEHGMWESAFERANESRRARMAHNRSEQLDERLSELREQKQRLTERYENGSISHEEYVSEASRLSGRIEALEDGVNGTSTAAERAGLNVTSLNELRTNARNLSGPDVAGIAQGLASGDRVPPAGVPGRGPPGEDDGGTDGPPADAPGQGNGADGNVSTETTTLAGGPEAGGNSGNATRGPGTPDSGDDAGPGQSGNDPGDGGPGNDDAGQGGNGPDDAGSGNGGPDDGGPGNGGPGGSGSGDGGPDRGPNTLDPTDTLFSR